MIGAQPYNPLGRSRRLIVSNPLSLHHEKLGAQLDSTNSPISFSDPVEEYWTIKKAAGIADVSSSGLLAITGKDRVAFLNGLLTSDVSKIDEDGGQHSALLNPKARVLADLYLYRQRESILVDAGNCSASSVKGDLERFIITEDVQVKNASTDLVHLTIQGPRSSQAIRETLQVGVEHLKPLHHTNLGPSTIIARDRTGTMGYDIVLPRMEAEAVWQGFLLKAGDTEIRPVGSKAMETLRVEAGYPKYGIDLDQDTIVLEAGFKDAISFTKGCYLGQEVVARATHIGRVNKQLVKLEISSTAPPTQRSKLVSNGLEAGYTTSAAYSPGLGKVAALAYASRDYAKEGSELAVDAPSGQASALVTKVL
jgi:folate-binding protein YgfZ